MATKPGFQYRQKITLNTASLGFSGNLTDMPVLVKLDSTNFDFTLADSSGTDICFTDNDGETLLKFERENHDSVGEEAYYWVKVPTILAGSDKNIYIYYGNPSAVDGEDANSVWKSNFKAVHHLKESGSGSAGEFLDSTSNNNDGQGGAGVPADVPTQINGQIFKAQDFDGGDDNIEVPQNTSMEPTNVSISAWISVDSDQLSKKNILSKLRNSPLAPSYGLEVLSDEKVNFFVFTDSSNFKDRQSTTTLSIGVKTHIVGTYDGTSAKIYINGTEEAGTTGGSGSGNIDYTNSSVYRIGDSIDLDSHDGLIDESRVYDGVLNSEEIKFLFESESNNLLTFGNIETFNDINTDIRVKHTEVLEDINTDIRVVTEVLEDINTDIRVRTNEILEDINTDIRVVEEVLEDINTDIRTVQQTLDDISTDIRVYHKVFTSRVIVNSISFQEGRYLNSNSGTLELDVFGAVKMQFRNENETEFSPFETFSTSKIINLSSGDGVKTVFVRFQDIFGDITDGQDLIEVVVTTVAPTPVTIEAYEDETATTSIPSATFQTDNTPFFQWSVPISDVPYESYSFEIDDDPDDIVNIITPNIVRNGIIVSKETPPPEMTFKASDGFFYYNQDLKEFSEQSITLDDGGSQDRIDLIYISAQNESLNVIKGTESASPLVPESLQDGIDLATVLVPAGETLIANTTLTDIRDTKVKVNKFVTSPLESGQHTFKVKAFLADGSETSISTFDIYVAEDSPEMGEIFAYDSPSKTIQFQNGIYQTSDDTPFFEWTPAPAEPGPIQYHYTTDGSEPTQSDSFTSGTTLSLGPFSEGITILKIKPFDNTTNNFGSTKEFIFIFGSQTFTDDTAVIGPGVILKQSLKEIQVKTIKWDFDSARNCRIFQPALFDDNLPLSVGDEISVVHGSSNTTVFRGTVKVIERMIDSGAEGVMYNCIGPRGKLNECYATINDLELGDTAQVVFEDVPIATAITTIANMAPDTIKNIDSFPTGANVSDEFIAQTISQILSRIYERTKFGWYIKPNGSLVSVDSTAINSGEAKFGVFGTTVSSISPQFNVMGSNLQFDSTRRYKRAIIEGSRKRERVTLTASCGIDPKDENTLIAEGDRASGLKYKIFTLNTDKRVVKVIETSVTYARLKKFTLIPIGSTGFGGISSFNIVLQEWEICRDNNIKRYTRQARYSTLSSVPVNNIGKITDTTSTASSSPALGGGFSGFLPLAGSFPVSQKLVGFSPVLEIEEGEEVQGTLGPGNTIRFSREMYTFWPTGTSFNTSGLIVAQPGVDANNPIAPSYFWREVPKKRCASVSADVLIETEPLRADVSVSGTADPNCILRIVRTEFKFDEDPDNFRDDTAEMIQYATDSLQKYKDIIVNGFITLDTIDLTWDLDKTVNLINTQQGSWSTLNIKVVGIRYDFDANTTTLEVTSEFLK